MMVRFLAEGEAWSSAPDAGEWHHPVRWIVIPRWSLSHAKRVQTESRTTSPRLIVMPRCSLSYAKRVQTESRTTSLCLIVMPRCSLSYAKIGK